MLLANRSVIVTGASSGIGAAAARLFARHGAMVVIGARRERELSAVAEDIRAANGVVAALAGDVTEAGYADALVATAVREFGGLDVAFNNAGRLGSGARLADTPVAEWNAVIETNLSAAFHCARAQLPALLARGGGSIIFTGSFIGHTATLPGMGAYATAKAGLIGLTQAIAVEYGPEGVRANTLLPGGTLTDMAMDARTNPETRDFISGLHALKRLAEPEEIAAAALFLASDLARFVTGSAMRADGGASVTKV